jgi:hypothetical protein
MIALELERHGITVLSFEELGWGIALIAISMVIHAIGMLFTLVVCDALQRRLAAIEGFFISLFILVLTSWMIVVVHLMEVVVWAGFLFWKDAMPTPPAAFYYALLQYVTVGSNLTLPVQWRLLGGMIGIAGLLTFAWSTAVLLTVVHRFEERQLALMARLHFGKPATVSRPGREAPHQDPPAR